MESSRRLVTPSESRQAAIDNVEDLAQARRAPTDARVIPGIDETIARMRGEHLPIEGPRKALRRLSVGLTLTDLISLVAALFVAHFVRYGTKPLPADYLILVCVAPLLWLVVFRGYGLYGVQHLSPWEEFRRTVSAVSLGLVLVILASYWSHTAFSRGWIALTWVIAVVFVLSSRRLWRIRISALRVQGILSFRTLIVGTNGEALRLAETLKEPGSGYLPVGFISVGPADRVPNGLPVVGTIDDLPLALREGAAECLFVATTCVAGDDVIRIAQAARQQSAEVRVTANMPQIIAPRLSIQQVGKIMALSLKPVQLGSGQAAVKRGFDFVVASVLLILALPLMLVIAIGIKLGSRGPVLFRQHRVTKRGRIFEMLKFRTMRANADQILAERGIDSSVPFFKLDDDPRLTRFGAFLRRFSLDELPQLLNVVKGEMSLVGPRPLPADQVAANLDLLGPRHEVPAGCTGWWQISGRSNVGPEEAVEMDLFYIENWSLGLDIYVLLKTVGAVLSKRGAH
ncbi:MAG TPA: sugar transferase [Actinomycetota bacterium]